MQAPVTMLKSTAGSKAAIVLAMLIGLALMTALNKPATAAPGAKRAP